MPLTYWLNGKKIENLAEVFKSNPTRAGETKRYTIQCKNEYEANAVKLEIKLSGIDKSAKLIQAPTELRLGQSADAVLEYSPDPTREKGWSGVLDVEAELDA